MIKKRYEFKLTMLLMAPLLTTILNIPVTAAFGDLDTTYSSDGIFTDTFDFEPTGIARQSDGKMLIVGHVKYSGDPYDTLILRRYNSSGGLDTTFGWNSNALPYNTFGAGFALYVQSDGKIVVAGHHFTSPTISKGAVWRFNSNGSYDSGFGVNGRVLLGGQIGFSAIKGFRLSKTDPLDLYVLSSNKKVYCLQPNGSLKTSFGSGGSFTGSVDPTYPDALAVRSTGIYVSGRNSSTTAAISRHNLSGQVDLAFGTNGVADQDAFSSLNCQYAPPILGQTEENGGPIAFQSDGKIVTKVWHGVMGPQFIVGSVNILTRQNNADGSFDTGFSDSCSQGPLDWITPQTDSAGLLNVLTDDRIIESRRDNGGNDTIHRYTATGIPDGEFGVGPVYRLLTLSDGKIVVVTKIGGQVRLSRHLS